MPQVSAADSPYQITPVPNAAPATINSSIGPSGTIVLVSEALKRAGVLCVDFPARRPKKPPGFDTGTIGVLLPVLPLIIDDAADEVPLAGVCKPLAGVETDKLVAEGFRETVGV